MRFELSSILITIEIRLLFVLSSHGVPPPSKVAGHCVQFILKN